ncbi:hypothetical protein Ciccas_001684 [Cichlidogyrus casuarinus]|uniref:Uncharacterized protein n=1 Tax=Cichlidogyrus casuarinus TaxID=1844966 RepID=A0ABD2QJW2_9PLAT
MTEQINTNTSELSIKLFYLQCLELEEPSSDSSTRDICDFFYACYTRYLDKDDLFKKHRLWPLAIAVGNISPFYQLPVLLLTLGFFLPALRRMARRRRGHGKPVTIWSFMCILFVAHAIYCINYCLAVLVGLFLNASRHYCVKLKTTTRYEQIACSFRLMSEQIFYFWQHWLLVALVWRRCFRRGLSVSFYLFLEMFYCFVHSI